MNTEQPTPGGADDALQFDTAEPNSAQSAALTCAFCRSPIQTVYHQTRGQTICSACRATLESPVSGSYLKALLFGSGAGIAGWVVYYAVLRLTDTNFALIAILVGWMVGRAVLKASGERGGRGFQVMAVLLAYVAMCAIYAPFILEEMQLAGTAAGVVGAVVAFVLSMSAPFLIMPSSPISLLIFGFGLWQAWSTPRKAEMEFTGPHSVAPAAAAEEPEPALA